MHASSIADLKRNHLLSLLKPEVQQRLLSLLKSVTVNVGQSVSEADRPASTVYFPLSCVSSSLKTLEDGVTVEMATVGNEGFIGVPLVLGTQHEPMDAIAQVGGEALTMSAEDFISTIEDVTTGLRTILLLYTQAVFNQVVQNAACNRGHSVEQRCARWILMTQDRVHEDSFILGRHFISYMLAAPESSVTNAIDVLSKAHLIIYTGGRMRILDRERLQQASCRCYGLIKREYDRLLNTAL
jgi:hypothetical protein